MKDAQPKAIFLKDYTEPNYYIEKTNLCFDLFEDHAVVSSELHIVRNLANSLVLNGLDLELLSVAIDGVALAAGTYTVTDETLELQNLPDACILQIQTKIKPQENTLLEGLYKSSKMFCTQCEAEGFRRITYYLDRPDVMSVFETTVIAEKSKYPVLLSNGNHTESQELENGRHKAVWSDPHKKPCYLFALVAGDLEYIEDHFITMSGTDVTLKIFVESENIDKCDYAMDALKRSMKWDEDEYGREYDLDIFNIVAVDDFNMGAMENKSLNIFNSSCVLANPKTATDVSFQRIEAIVAHEYFHNWTGNRVTCRDWFQLSLKEGFTVFRDSEFSADMGSRSVKRIEDAMVMRTSQFAEDAGPMAHPIRPASFIEISNFYTLTIYEKGAEVVRMIHNLLGKENFRKGSDLYFDRHDGQAVTTDDFVIAMEDASGVDLTQFRHWYHQAGTPELHIDDEYDANEKRYTLTVKQSCPVTPETKQKQAFHIPLEVGLMLDDGTEALLKCEHEHFNSQTNVIGITQFEETFVFNQIDSKPVPSLLRSFSAPVKLAFNYSRDQLLFLMAHDTDGFNRWDAGQKLATEIILELADCVVANKALSLDQRLIDVFRSLLKGEQSDKAMLAQMLTLPSLAFLMEQSTPANVHALFKARSFVKTTIANKLQADFHLVYQNCINHGVYEPESGAMAQRTLKNLSLQYMLESGDETYLKIAVEQFKHSDNMTDQSSALTAIVNSRWQDTAQICLAEFYAQWKHDALVINLWLGIQAASDQISSIDVIDNMLRHESFDIKNPNKVRSVVGVFAGQNLRHFHQADGAGYEWLANRVIELDSLNPQIAARLLGSLTKWKRLDVESGQLMKQSLERISNSDNLSKDVYEVVHKSLVN